MITVITLKVHTISYATIICVIVTSLPDHNGTTTSEVSSCISVAQLVQKVIVRLDLTTEECLEHAENKTDTRTTSSEGESNSILY